MYDEKALIISFFFNEIEDNFNIQEHSSSIEFVSSTFWNILEHTCIPVLSWKKSKKKHTGNFYRRFFVFHIFP